MSKDANKKRSDSLRAYYANNPKRSQSEESNKKRSIACKKAWALKSDKEKALHAARIGKIVKERCANMSVSKRKSIGAKLSATWTDERRKRYALSMHQKFERAKVEGIKWGGGGNNKGTKHTDKTRKKMSLTHRKGFASGEREITGNYKVRRHCIRTKKAGTIQCHSAWEVYRAKELDKDSKIISFEKDAIRIQYKYKGIQRTYIPDFIIYQVRKKILEEVKPEFRLKIAREKAKFKAAKLWCEENGFVFRIWNKP